MASVPCWKRPGTTPSTPANFPPEQDHRPGDQRAVRQRPTRRHLQGHGLLLFAPVAPAALQAVVGAHRQHPRARPEATRRTPTADDPPGPRTQLPGRAGSIDGPCRELRALPSNRLGMRHVRNPRRPPTTPPAPPGLRRARGARLRFATGWLVVDMQAYRKWAFEKGEPAPCLPLPQNSPVVGHAWPPGR